MLTDTQAMQRAISLAKNGLFTTAPNPRVGCVIVKNDCIVGEGWHEKAGLAHAEVNALQAAGQHANGATCYVTLEPCAHHGRTPPCVDALIAAGIARVVIAMVDPNPQVAGKSVSKLQQQGIKTDIGILCDQAKALNPGFCKRMHQGLPFVRSKLAISLDGRIAMASGESQWLTSAEARQDGQQWRARSSAIISGIGTIIADNPQLTVRLHDIVEQPLRVVLDTQLRTPPSAELFNHQGDVIIFTASQEKHKITALQQKGATLITTPIVNSHVDATFVLQELAHRECNEVHLEAGGILTGALLQQGLIDELLLYIAPKFLGNNAQAMLQLPTLQRLSDAIDANYQGVERIGNDLRIQLNLTTT